MLEVMKDRPPYVTFETRAIEDRNASIAAGHEVTKDVDFAIVTPMGSKDRIERVVSEWFEHLRVQTEQGRFEGAWYEAFKVNFRLWKEGQEPPLVGTAIKSWPLASPSQVRTMLEMGLRSVEDLANCNEEGLKRLGMGARALKDKAVAWLAEAAGPGRSVEALEALRVENSMLKERNDTMAEQLKTLAVQVAALSKPVSA